MGLARAGVRDSRVSDADLITLSNTVTPTPMAVMAWFKKERKPRTSQRERLEIPPDAWEKCDGCGHIDLREKFEKALNVCPECGRHRRFSAEEYIELLDRCRHLARAVRRAPVHRSPQLRALRRPAGEPPARRAATPTRSTPAPRRLDGLPSTSGVMNFAFMGGSMGSVVGEKIARLARRSLEKKVPLVLVCDLGRRPHAGRRALPHADGQDLGGHRPARTALHSLHLDPDQSDHRRRVGLLRHAG